MLQLNTGLVDNLLLRPWILCLGCNPFPFSLDDRC